MKINEVYKYQLDGSSHVYVHNSPLEVLSSIQKSKHQNNSKTYFRNDVRITEYQLVQLIDSQITNILTTANITMSKFQTRV